jgi:hypothetical protein
VLKRRTNHNGANKRSEAAQATVDEATTSPTGSNGNGHKKVKTIAEVGRTIPADYLAVGNDSVAYDLRVQSIERSGLPDVLVDTAEAQPPGHFGEDSPLRPEMDDLISGAARRLAEDERRGGLPSSPRRLPWWR